MVLPELRFAEAVRGFERVPDRGPAVELDPVPLAVVEAYCLDLCETGERPGKTGGRILAAREKDEGALIRALRGSVFL
jgi:hypothetical protein